MRVQRFTSAMPHSRAAVLRAIHARRHATQDKSRQSSGFFQCNVPKARLNVFQAPGGGSAAGWCLPRTCNNKLVPNAVKPCTGKYRDRCVRTCQSDYTAQDFDVCTMAKFAGTAACVANNCKPKTIPYAAAPCEGKTNICACRSASNAVRVRAFRSWSLHSVHRVWLELRE